MDAHAHADGAEAFGLYNAPGKLIRFMDEAGIANASVTSSATEPGPEAARERLLNYGASIPIANAPIRSGRSLSGSWQPTCRRRIGMPF